MNYGKGIQDKRIFQLVEDGRFQSGSLVVVRDLHNWGMHKGLVDRCGTIVQPTDMSPDNKASEFEVEMFGWGGELARIGRQNLVELQKVKVEDGTVKLGRLVTMKQGTDYHEKIWGKVIKHRRDSRSIEVVWFDFWRDLPGVLPYAEVEQYDLNALPSQP